MPEESPANVHRGFDDQGNVAELVHLGGPVTTEASDPQLAIQEYLEKYGAELGIEPTQVHSLTLAPDATPTDTKVEFRYHEEKSLFDTTTFAYHQTALGLPVWRGGVAVTAKTDPMRVLGAQSTAQRDVSVEQPSDAAVKRFETVDAALLGELLELTGGTEIRDVRSSTLVIFRYDASRRLEDSPDEQHDHPEMTVQAPPPASSVEDGKDYVAADIVFTAATAGRPELAWNVVVEVETGSVLYLRAFIDDVNGFVFRTDPITQTGNVADTPAASTAALTPVRSSVVLTGLPPPAPGTNQKLQGNLIKIVDFEPATVAPPTEPVGTDFNFDVRTNDFTAVNAYYHTDLFFRMVADLGFPIGTYFDGTTFPIPVDHRGRYTSTDGIERNASCSGTGSGGIANVDFELADLGDTAHPIGIADDLRVVFHELGGHGILYDHVNSANLGFAHSVGDSFGAIFCDPDTLAPDRFETFPWVNFVGRRHDRAVASGWGFGGTSDTGGYNTEQILCTTHFRAYLSMGGGSADLNMRRFASRFMRYLLLRAVGTLTPATTPSGAAGGEGALLTADLGDWTSEGHIGGAYGKVIRWAFEKQGLHQPPSHSGPTTAPGAPPAVDVYIDDGRHGEYQFQPNFWSNQSVWNRRHPDGGTVHEDPIVGHKNFAYVKIKNRGTSTATGVVVKGFHANPSTGLLWPNNWQAMTTASIAAPNVAANNAAEITVGPFTWVPSALNHECMLMIVSAQGDPSNVSNFGAGESIPEWRLVPHDNNIGQRNVHPVSAFSLEAILKSFEKMVLVVGNPNRKVGRAIVTVKLPKLLLQNEWKPVFRSAGGGAFALQPGE